MYYSNVSKYHKEYINIEKTSKIEQMKTFFKEF